MILSLSLGLSVGCARTSADRAPAEPAGEDEVGRTTASSVAVGDASRTGGEPQGGQATGAGPTTYADYPLVVTSVFIEPTLASACGLTMSPKAFFEFDSTDLDKGDTAVLRHIGTCLSTGPLAGRRVELVGHADPRGPDEYNQRLGRSRAEAVQQFLVTQGVSADNLRIRSAGERMATSSDPSEWPHERRVDLILVPAP